MNFCQDLKRQLSGFETITYAVQKSSLVLLELQMGRYP